MRSEQMFIAVLASAILAACGGQPASSSAGSAPTSAGVKPAASAGTSAAASRSPNPAASASQALKPIKVGYAQQAVFYAPFVVGKDTGVFSKYGLDVNLQRVSGGPAAIPALLADEVQVHGGGSNEVTRAVLAGAPITSIATMGDLPVLVLVADKKYKSVEDLAGQSVGVTALGSATDIAARLFLDHYKVLDKVKVVPTGGTTAGVYAALQQGLVAAAVMGPDTAADAVSKGFITLVDGVKLGVPLNFGVVAIKTSYGKENPDTVRNFLRGYTDAWNYLGNPANKAAVVASLARFLQESPELAESAYTPWFPVWTGKKVPTIDPESIVNILRFSDDPKARSAKPEQFIDESYLKSIQ